MSDTENVLFERVAPGVGIVTLNRPKRGNGVTPELARDLAQLLDDLEPDRSLRSVVITGAGKQFCAGADLVAFRQYLRDEYPQTGEPFNARILFPVTQRLTTSRIVFVAAVNGGATAGGLDLALACDLRVASTLAKFGETYINLGLVPGNGGTWFLPRLVGSGVAAEMALTGEVFGAERALRLGIVSKVVNPDELMVVTLEMARAIAAKPWRALEATKKALRSTWEADLIGSMDSSYWALSALHIQRDLSEAIDAFLEKRAPVFNRDVDDSRDEGGPSPRGTP